LYSLAILLSLAVALILVSGPARPMFTMTSIANFHLIPPGLIPVYGPMSALIKGLLVRGFLISRVTEICISPIQIRASIIISTN
jgi:hypothetical protein